MPHILVVEDEAIIRNALGRLLERHGFDVSEAHGVEDAEQRFALDSFDLIITDLRLPGQPGTALLDLSPAPVLIMASYASIKSAVDAIRQGAADYIAKPFNHDELLHSVRQILDRIRRQRRRPTPFSDSRHPRAVAGIIGHSATMVPVLEAIHHLGPSDRPVLLLGEAGTGKALVARALHDHSERRGGPLIPVSCMAIPVHLLDTELFGYEDPDDDRPEASREGLVDAAHGGTLFLDEIGVLPVTTQSRLWQLLQTGEVQRPGSGRPLCCSLRLIAASQQDLARRVREARFQEALYQRLRSHEIRLPPLRERDDDIVTLATCMLNKTCQRLNHPPMRFARETLDAIRHYPWPGNVRELENAVERAVILNAGTLVTPELLALNSAGADRASPDRDNPANMSLDDYFLYFVLSNQDRLSETELARRLGISRKSLWERRQRLGIPKPRRGRGSAKA